jgi:hypothetical protein
MDDTHHAYFEGLLRDVAELRGALVRADAAVAMLEKMLVDKQIADGFVLAPDAPESEAIAEFRRAWKRCGRNVDTPEGKADEKKHSQNKRGVDN